MKKELEDIEEEHIKSRKMNPKNSKRRRRGIEG
jgi:hypothetical protein